jgi:hypothetical protein
LKNAKFHSEFLTSQLLKGKFRQRISGPDEVNMKTKAINSLQLNMALLIASRAAHDRAYWQPSLKFQPLNSGGAAP